MKRIIIALLVLSTLAFLVFGRPALTPDESVYVIEAKLVSGGLPLSQLDEFKNRLLYIASLSTAFSIFGFDLTVARSFVFISSLACAVIVFEITRMLTKNARQALLAGAFFAFMPIVITLSQGLLSEMPSLAFSMLSILLFLKSKNGKLAFLAGICAAAGFLMREQTAVIPFAFLAAHFIFEKREWRKYLAFAAGFLLLAGAWTLAFGFNYLQSYFLNAEYVKTIAPSFIPGFAMIPFSIAAGGGAAAVLAVIALAVGKRNKLLWFWFALGAASMLVIPRVEVRFAIVALAPLAVIAGEGAEWLWQKNRIALVALAIISLAGGWAMASYWSALNDPAVFHETASFVNENGGKMVSQLCFSYEATDSGLEIKCIADAKASDFNNGFLLVEHSNHVFRSDEMAACSYEKTFSKQTQFLWAKNEAAAYSARCAE